MAKFVTKPCVESIQILLVLEEFRRSRNTAIQFSFATSDVIWPNYERQRLFGPAAQVGHKTCFNNKCDALNRSAWRIAIESGQRLIGLIAFFQQPPVGVRNCVDFAFCGRAILINRLHSYECAIIATVR